VSGIAVKGFMMFSHIRRNAAPNGRMKIVAVLTVLLWSTTAHAQAQGSYPERSIRFVVAFAAGGVADATARILSQSLSRRLGQTVVVENRGGAGGNIAAQVVSRASPDGYTVLITTTAIAINETLYKNRGYETGALAPVAIVASTPDIIAVSSANPAKSLADFIKRAKDKPITFGTAGVGSPSFVAATYFFKVLAKIDATHVPFQGGAPAVNAIVANNIDSIAISLPSVAPQINYGHLRGLGIAAPKRSAALPDVPTYADGGYPDFYSDSWMGIFVPAATDPAIIKRLNDAIEEALQEPGVSESLKKLGFEVILNSRDEAEAMFKSETQKWGSMVKQIKLTIE
jgi:tripartite-type tricarboxylate transporter receptor subunit TctC